MKNLNICIILKDNLIILLEFEIGVTMFDKKTPKAKKNKKPVSQRIAAWKTWKKVVLGFGGTMCILFMVLAVYAVATLAKLDIDKLDQDPTALGIVNTDEHSDDIINIALFGIDTTSSNFIGRSDAIVILTIDKKHKDVKLSSVMRDAYVDFISAMPLNLHIRVPHY